MRIGQGACGVFQLLRAHVFGRRVDPVAHAQAGGDQVGHLAGRCRHQPGRCTVALAVAVEAVAAQAPPQLQQGQFGGRQFAGQLPHAAFWQGVRGMRIAVGITTITHTHHRTGQAIAAGQQGHAVRAGGEALRRQPGLGGGRLAVLPGRELLAVQHVQRQR
uniref:Uncharacterized protein n=1 Tax=Panagrolaimus superbus TaxID=310955 RepID=A0A914YFX1_9BILA